MTSNEKVAQLRVRYEATLPPYADRREALAMLSERDRDIGWMLTEIDRLQQRLAGANATIAHFLGPDGEKHIDRFAALIAGLAQQHIAETPAYALGVAKDCPKCGGAGWLRGSELDNPSEDTYVDSMTRYSCDGEQCVALRAATETGGGPRNQFSNLGPDDDSETPAPHVNTGTKVGPAHVFADADGNGAKAKVLIRPFNRQCSRCGDLTVDLPPSIAALMALLPPAGSFWPADERNKWIAAFNALLDLNYSPVQTEK